MVEAKFRLLSLELPDWWIKVTTTATTTPLMTISMHSAAANAVSNPLCTVNAANAVYEEEQ
jgi:hypothetical protein